MLSSQLCTYARALHSNFFMQLRHIYIDQLAQLTDQLEDHPLHEPQRGPQRPAQERMCFYIFSSRYMFCTH